MASELRIIEGRYLKDLLDQPGALKETCDGLEEPAKLEDLAGRLKRGEFRRVLLTGMGSSFHAQHPLSLALTNLGVTALMVETSELIHYRERLLDSGTLTIAVSQSGESVETVRMAELNQGRSPVIGVTNAAGSTLAKNSTAALVTRAGSEFSVSCKTYVATLMMLEWLACMLSDGDLEQCRGELAAASEGAEEYLSKWREHVVSIAGRLEGVRQLFLAGRGRSLAAVGAGSLVIKESDHFPAEGMSSAAFRHGPVEMLGKETFVLVFAGDEKTRGLNGGLVKDIHQAGGRGELVGEDAPLRCFRLPKHTSRIRPILEILPVQMMTIALAALAGREAGKFDRATKVTTAE